MAATLHLLHDGERGPLALDAIARAAEAGDQVTVVLLHGAPAPALPAGITVRRAPDDLAWPDLLDLIFSADHVIAW